MVGDATSFSPLAVPAEHIGLPKNHLDASVQDVAYLYDAYADDVTSGTATVSTFTDAVLLHRLLDQVTRSSEGFLGSAENETTWN